MNLVKRIGKIFIILSFAILSIGYTNSFAKDENNAFFFKIKEYHGNGRVDTGRYRETTNPKNMWKVGMKFSGEGNSTVTFFWLEHKNEDNVSDDMKVKQSMTTQYYKEADESANKSVVYLTGENNNYNSNTYNVSGYWDEETDKYAG